MLRRFLVRSLALAAILAACFAHLIWNGWHAQKTVAENLPHPALSSGKRDIDLWHPTASFGHVYDLTWVWPEDKPWTLPEGSHLEIQLSSNGRTRPLVVRPGHPNTGVSWWDVLRRRGRLQIVADREWVDLGELPPDQTKLEVQIYGLLPGPFGFAEPNQPGTEHFQGFRIRLPSSPLARPSRTIVRYRFRVGEPVTARETLTRFFFFISCSRVLQFTGALALVLLFCGWWWLWEKRAARAVACLVPALTLLHACCLAPLQGADEATHAGTVEAVLFNPGLFKNPAAYPKSIARLYDAIGYADWVGHAEVPVTGLLPGQRDTTRDTISESLSSEAAENAGPLPDAYVINPRIRAPLYYNSFRLFGPVLRRLSVLDRVEAYVVLSALGSLAFFLAGLFVLVHFEADPGVAVAYGLIALWPYSVGVVASCSNYSLAIGIGQFLAACLVAGVLSASPGPRMLASVLFSLTSLAGIGVWDDFVFVAVPSLAVTTILAVAAVWRLPDGKGRRLAVGAVVLAGALATLTFVASLATGWIRRLVSSLGARVPKELGGFEDPSLWLLLAVAAAPLVVSLLLVLSMLRAHDWPAATRRRAAWIRSAFIALLFIGLFLATRWTAVPFEFFRFDYPDEVFAHWATFWSNAFSFDQDVLSWQMYFGVFGYADVSYPAAMYALARWSTVGLLIALPLLSWKFTQRSPARAAFFLSAFGFALSVCIVSNSLRYFLPSNPYGRFILPVLPLGALPLLARIEATRARAELTRLAVAILVILHTWTAVTLLGTRYAVGI